MLSTLLRGNEELYEFGDKNIGCCWCSPVVQLAMPVKREGKMEVVVTKDKRQRRGCVATGRRWFADIVESRRRRLQQARMSEETGEWREVRVGKQQERREDRREDRRRRLVDGRGGWSAGEGGQEEVVEESRWRWEKEEAEGEEDRRRHCGGGVRPRLVREKEVEGGTAGG
ncbi:hypothetical protein KSS87_010031 [Heliosperma pusillum]|nr:hypothetical protein KSS87_010031 [Heliosperma pusillum]